MWQNKWHVIVRKCTQIIINCHLSKKLDEPEAKNRLMINLDFQTEEGPRESILWVNYDHNLWTKVGAKFSFMQKFNFWFLVPLKPKNFDTDFKIKFLCVIFSKTQKFVKIGEEYSKRRFIKSIPDQRPNLYSTFYQSVSHVASAFQGDQIRRFFAHWVIVYFGQFL
jgi:hypothetical protein